MNKAKKLGSNFKHRFSNFGHSFKAKITSTLKKDKRMIKPDESFFTRNSDIFIDLGNVRTMLIYEEQNTMVRKMLLYKNVI